MGKLREKVGKRREVKLTTRVPLLTQNANIWANRVAEVMKVINSELRISPKCLPAPLECSSPTGVLIANSAPS